MTRWLIDSTVFVDASREREPGPATTFLARAAREGEPWSVTPVRTEIRWGMQPTEAQVVDRLSDHIFWLGVTTELADRAGAFGQRYGRTHGLDVVDAIVAAAAETLSASLATANVRHFPMFPDLLAPY